MYVMPGLSDVYIKVEFNSSDYFVDQIVNQE